MYSLEAINSMNNKENDTYIRKEVYVLSAKSDRKYVAALAHLGIDTQQHYVVPEEGTKKYLVTIKV